MQSVAGHYRHGIVEMDEAPPAVREETRVVVVFPDLPVPSNDLRQLGMHETQARDLRARLKTFAEDWDSPEMDLYDNYDAARPHSQTR